MVLLLQFFSVLIFISFAHFSSLVNAVFNPVTKPIIDICVGRDHACAVFNDYKMKCWGQNSVLATSLTYGNSPSTVGDNIPYFNAGTSKNITNVACSELASCLLLSDGFLKCFGSNYGGQAGLGITDSLVGPSTGFIGDNHPVVNLGTGVLATAIVAGYRHTCALTTERKVKCFGGNFDGQLGLNHTSNIGRSPSDMGDNLPYVEFGVDAEVASVHALSSGRHTCVILSAPIISEQRIKCWGSNDKYQLGYGDNTNRGGAAGQMGDNLPLVNLGSESRVKRVSPGYQHSCVLLINDVLKCFGFGTYGQIGSGSSAVVTTGSTSSSIVLTDSGKIVAFVQTGYLHTCILYDDMLTMKCVGLGTNGQLGQEDANSRGDTPTTMVPSIPAINLGTGTLKIKSIHSGAYSNCVVFVDSSVKCLGYNSNGQLAIGSTKSIGDGPGEMGSNLQFAELFSPTQSPTQSPSSSPTPPTHPPSKSPTRKPSTNSTLTPSRSPSVSPTKLPTLSPTRKCDYQSAKLCKYDYDCDWRKVEDRKMCVIFDCATLNEGKCAKERTRCKWNKKSSTCTPKKNDT